MVKKSVTIKPIIELQNHNLLLLLIKSVDTTVKLQVKKIEITITQSSLVYKLQSHINWDRWISLHQKSNLSLILI